MHCSIYDPFESRWCFFDPVFFHSRDGGRSTGTLDLAFRWHVIDPQALHANPHNPFQDFLSFFFFFLFDSGYFSKAKKDHRDERISFFSVLDSSNRYFLDTWIGNEKQRFRQEETKTFKRDWRRGRSKRPTPLPLFLLKASFPYRLVFPFLV